MRTQYSNPAIQKAFTVLEKLSADEETRYQAEMRERALKNKVSELAAAKEEGKLIGQIRLLQEILKHPMSSEEELAQKSIEELNEMLLELKAELT